MTQSPDRLASATQILTRHSQAHVLHFYDQLSDGQQDQLLGQIESIDWVELAHLIQTQVQEKPIHDLPDQVEPAPYFPNKPDAQQAAEYAQARAVGSQLIRDGKVAAFTVAGGQGTRLGHQGPKGTFPATPIRELCLFGCFGEFIDKTQRKYDCTVPWYIMTSPANDADTRAFFEREEYFGLDPANIMFFPQGMMPAMDMQTGKVLLQDRDCLALSPNGHGGSLKALYTSGAIEDMKSRGIKQISYFQVDNPTVKAVDPLFLGLHSMAKAQMSSKMVAKADPMERVGVFCVVDGRIVVIEYSDLPDALATQTHEDGSLRFNGGSIAIHAIEVGFVEQLNTQGQNSANDNVAHTEPDAGQHVGGFSLPFHRAEKKVSHIDLETGQSVEPTSPNAIKLETFVFDALGFCDRSIVYETDRAEEFAPIKNASGPGVLDSPQTSQHLQTERAARWLASKGVMIPRHDGDGTVDAVIEITALTAIEPEDLDDANLPEAIETGAQLLL
jgi:UDP-N-acetylglucosamine/UDP-N-acetylgalactosamine diphosphorylase